MILLIDNYDSFVYNLARYVSVLGFQYKVVRNDTISLDDIEKISPSHIIISPGPCTPNEAGISLSLIKKFGGKIPILGVCLGHQAIAQAYGGRVERASKPTHGKASWITHTERGIFSGIKNPLKVGRYHSLIADGLPDELSVTARTEEGEVMALQHVKHPVYGVQFHPESILTECGYDLLRNFLET
jgi:para-aminobenzoate synthetase component II